MILRPATLADAAACRAIYDHNAVHGTGTFEEVAPSVEEMSERIASVLARGLPYLVAEEDDAVVGLACAGPFRPRSAYRYTVEDSVYVAPHAQGQGIGKALLDEVLSRCETLGVHQVLAVIGDSANAGSIGLHMACGFVMIGRAEGLGFKHDRFLDVVFMQKALNGGVGVQPSGAGVPL